MNKEWHFAANGEALGVLDLATVIEKLDDELDSEDRRTEAPH